MLDGYCVSARHRVKGVSMRRIFVLAAITSLLALCVRAQSGSEYQTWMKTVAESSASMQKDIADKKFDAVVADARQIENTFKQVEAFWRSRNTMDAVNFAKQVQSEAATVEKTITSGDMERPYLRSVVSVMVENVAGSCGGCHNAHRERLPDGTFRMK